MDVEILLLHISSKFQSKRKRKD